MLKNLAFISISALLILTLLTGASYAAPSPQYQGKTERGLLDTAEQEPGSEPVPSESVPSESAPSEPAPSEPAPSEPAPSEPVPSGPAPSEPAPSEPAPSEPAPSEPAPETGEEHSVLLMHSLSATKTIKLPKQKASISFSTETEAEATLKISAASGDIVYTRLISGLVPLKTCKVYWQGEINNTSGIYEAGKYVCGGVYTVRFSSADNSAVSDRSVKIKVNSTLAAPSGLDMSIDSANSLVTLKWDKTPYCKGYKLVLYRCGVSIYTASPGAETQSLDISALVAENGFTRYKFKLTATGDSYNSSSKAVYSGDFFVKGPDGEIALDSGYYDGFFNDSALIGDSISDGLRLYTLRQRKNFSGFLGSMRFFTVTSYNLNYACGYSRARSIKYNGKRILPQDALKAMGAKKVFIMIGMNDVFRKADSNIKKYETLIGNIREKNPEIEIYVIAVTPIVKSRERSGFTNTRVNNLNNALSQMCSRLGVSFINMNEALRNGGSGLYYRYSSDHFVHLNSSGLLIYANELRKAAKRDSQP